MNELKFSGKTVQDAVNAAAESLNIAADELKYEVIEEGKKGLFVKQDAVISVAVDLKLERARSFITEIIDKFPLEGIDVRVEETDGAVNIEINGEQASYLIGRRGDTLNALQYLAGLVVNNGEDKFSRVYLNINGYREKREKTLEALAKRLSNQVLRTGRSITLEPMAPYERRIIHATVQNIENVTSSSIGEEPNRKVVISSERGRYKGEGKGGRHGGKRHGAPAAAPKASDDSLIKDDFLNSSSTIEGLRREKELRDAALPLYSKIDL